MGRNHQENLDCEPTEPVAEEGFTFLTSLSGRDGRSSHPMGVAGPHVASVLERYQLCSLTEGLTHLFMSG